MKYTKSSFACSIHLSASLLVVAGLVSSCSGSSDSVSNGSVASDTQSSSEAEANNNADVSDGNSDATGAESDSTIAVEDTTDETTGQVGNEPDDENFQEEVDQPVSGNPVVEDPLIQNLIPVTFEITVPVYLSNELRVELSWGDINLTALWVGDQFWTASGDFPTDTEHQLTIIFYDNNGAIELAEFSQEYRTGSNATESFLVLAEQFDATQFDRDGDGVNNLSELIAGNDPLVDEDSDLEIEDFYAISNPGGVFSRMSVSESFESRLSENRPQLNTFESDPDSIALVSGNINIDTDGNGTLDVNADVAPRRNLLALAGTRTHSESSISWAGIRNEWGSEYTHIETVTNTVSIADANLRNFVEEVAGSNRGTFDFRWETSTNLMGNLIEGTSLCEPVAGTFTASHQTADPDISVVVTTVSKDIDDPYWRVIVEDDDANNLSDNESQTREYFVRELRILQREAAPESAFFICDFVDL